MNIYSEEFYRSHYEEYVNSRSRHAMNLEKDLEILMKPYADVPQMALDILKADAVKMIIETTTKKLVETMQTIKRIENGEACLGYTTQLQENLAMRELVDFFGFNCLQLADFKKKYL